MPKPIITGTTQPVKLSSRLRYDPTQGTTLTTEWHSAGDHLGGLASQYQRAGASYDHEFSPFRSRLVATESRNTFIATEQSVERWELLTNQSMLNIFEHPNFSALPIALRAKVRKDIARHENGQTVDLEAYEEEEDGGTALMFFRLATRGTTHYQAPQWVLRYTANVSGAYNYWIPANGGFNTIYTMSQAVSSLPGGRLRSTVASISDPPGNSDLIWGWLKASITETQVANGRVDVSAEYWLAQWPIILYS